MHHWFDVLALALTLGAGAAAIPVTTAASRCAAVLGRTVRKATHQRSHHLAMGSRARTSQAAHDIPFAAPQERPHTNRKQS